MRNALFRHINTLSYREIDKVGASSLVTRVVNDVNQMQSAVAMIIRLVVRAPFIAVCSVVICLVLDPPIGGIVAACAVFVGVILWLIMHKTVPYYTRNQRSLDRLTQIAGRTSRARASCAPFRAETKNAPASTKPRAIC